ncbi:MAG: GTPase HflX, partial [Halioglobus sp.]
TLEETLNADLLLHVVDAAAEERENNIFEVEDVLAEIGAGDIPCLQVFNKLDLLERPARIDRDEQGRPQRVWLSAVTGEGTDLLLAAVAELVGQDMVSEDVTIAPDQGGLRAALYDLGAVESERYGDDGVAHLHVRLPRTDWNRLMKKGPEPLF